MTNEELANEVDNPKLLRAIWGRRGANETLTGEMKMNATQEWEIFNHQWNQKTADAAAAAFILNPSKHNARHILSVLCSPSRPQPMLRCDHLGKNATTQDDRTDLSKQAMAILKS